MNTTQTKTHKRINVSLPEDTIAMIDRIAEKGNRSRLIDEAVRFYIEKKGNENLRDLLKEGAMTRAQQSLELAQEWFHLEEEVCEKDQR